MLKISNQHKGIIGTVVFHCLLLLCFFFMGFKTPLPLPEEIGTEIDMGGGGGGSSSSDVSTPASSSPEDYATQNSEESTALTNNKNKVIRKNVDNKVVEPKVDERFIYKKSNNNGSGNGNGNGNGPGTGPGSGPGDGGGNGPGHGPGNGPGFSLNGRSAKSLPAPDFSNIQGKVVVRIKVDPNGKVIDAEAISKGSTIANNKVWKKCEEYAMRAKFSAKSDAPDVQQGTITYIIE